MTQPDDETTTLAKIAFQAYSDATGGVDWQGLPLRPWAHLPERIQTAWIHAALAVEDYLTGD